MGYLTHFFICAVLVWPVMVTAQVVTVSKTGPADFTTIQAAIASFGTQMSFAPKLIQITDSSVYEEHIEINIPVTIQGSASSRPILAVRAKPGPISLGIDIYHVSFGQRPPRGIYKLQNLIIIPSLSSPPKTGIYVRGSDMDFYCENVLITANNGNDAPVSIDGLTKADMTDAVIFAGVGLSMDGTYFTGTLKKTVVTHLLHQGNSVPDGIMMGHGYYCEYRIVDGCVFSFNNRLGIHGSGNFEIDAPTTRCLIINNGGFAGIWFKDGNTKRRINGAIIANNAGFGIEQQNGGSELSISDSIIANNAQANLRVSEVRTNFDINLTNVTIANTTNISASAIDIDPASKAKIFLTDCIITGNGSNNDRNTIWHQGSGALNLEGSALVMDGPFAMTSESGGNGPVTGTPTTTADPHFVNSTDVTSLDYFDVANPAYAAAASAGGPLAGGADYVGGSSVSDWSVY